MKTDTAEDQMPAVGRPTKLCFPSARPYAFEFPLASTALMIVDVQRDFVDPGGFGSVECGNDELFGRVRSVVPVIAKVLDAFRSLGRGHVIFTREGHQRNLADAPASKLQRQANAPGGRHSLGIGDKGPMGRMLVRGEYGHDIVDELKPCPGELVIDKPGMGSFWGTDLHRQLLARGITHLIFTGVTTECCVTTTLRECNDRGFQCCVLEDCTAGYDPVQASVALDTICSHDGLFGFVGHSADFHKAISGLIQDDSQMEEATLPTDPSEKLPSMDTLLELYRRGRATPSEVVEFAYRRIGEYNKKDGAVWTCLRPREEAMQAAEELAAAYSGKALPPLYGMPFSVNDNIDVAHLHTMQTSPSCRAVPAENAFAVQCILNNGAILIGKTNMDQLAMGLSGMESPYGAPHNVFSNKHISGGSSSGSAVSVAAGLVSFSLGTDLTGGVRVPAALNGIVGLAPTRGTVSSMGLTSQCRTWDHIGVLASTVQEARKIWILITQYDRRDHLARFPVLLPVWNAEYRGYREGGFRFIVAPPSFLRICSPEYKRLFATAVQRIQACGGIQVNPENIWILEEAKRLSFMGPLIYEPIMSFNGEALRMLLDDLHPRLGEDIRHFLDKPPTASQVMTDQSERALLTNLVHLMFDTLAKGVDVVVLPTTPLHPRIASHEGEKVSSRPWLGDFTCTASVVDACTVAVPSGTYKDEEGTELPFGLMLMGGSGMDAKLLDIAAVFEQGP